MTLSSAHRPMFHVKQGGPGPTSFPNAKVAEDHVENILNVDPSCQPAESVRRAPKLFCKDILAPTHALRKRGIEGLLGRYQHFPMPLAANQSGLGAKKALNILGEALEQGLESTTVHRR